MILFTRQSLITFALLIAVSFWGGCTRDQDFANPFDPENLRTAGSPSGLELTPGSKQVKVSWQAPRLGGIVKYRIYRRFTGDLNSPFERVGEVDAPATEFIDTKNLRDDARNDQLRQLYYVYRISYVDKAGAETPDPNAPPGEDEEPRRIWPTAQVTPSVPPPVPNVTVGTPTDLTVKLFWQDYQSPEDFDVFRVFAAIPDASGDLEFRLLKNGVLRSEQSFYFDKNFDRDGIIKVYRVVAVDKFGVEAVAEIKAASPDLPPAPPKNVQAGARDYFFDPLRYDVRIIWSENTERDLKGYQIYATKAVGGNLVPGEDLVPRRTLGSRKTSVLFTGEEKLLVGQGLVRRRYFITTFDNTPRPDGSIDEGVRVEAILR